jgi:NitT/TauT family transport system permease protein
MRILGLQVCFLAAVAAAWQGAVQFSASGEFFFGSPAGIMREFQNLLLTGNLARHTSVTAVEAVIGFVLGVTLGSVIGLALWGSRTTYELLRPYLIVLGSVPVFALGPVLIFWFGTGIWSKIFLAFLATLVIAISQAYAGATEADHRLLQMVQAFGGSRTAAFRSVVVPSAMIWVLSSLRIGSGMALLGAFVGEFISSREGLGHMIIVAEGLYNMNQVWVGVICIALLALLFHSFAQPIERWATRWKL